MFIMTNKLGEIVNYYDSEGNVIGKENKPIIFKDNPDIREVNREEKKQFREKNIEKIKSLMEKHLENSNYGLTHEGVEFHIIDSWKEVEEFIMAFNEEKIYDETTDEVINAKRDLDDILKYYYDDNEDHWGFSDQYDVCCNCNEIIKTDTYYEKDYYYDDYGITCGNCVREDRTRKEEYINYLINDPEKANTILSWEEFRELEWKPSKEDNYENGLHPFQNDDPKEIIKRINTDKYDFIFDITSMEQFSVHFNYWIKEKKRNCRECGEEHNISEMYKELKYHEINDHKTYHRKYENYGDHKDDGYNYYCPIHIPELINEKEWDEESWTNWILIPRRILKGNLKLFKSIYTSFVHDWGFGVEPGEKFYRKPYIKKNKFHILIKQSGGYNI